MMSGEWELPLSLDNCRSPHVYINQRLQTQFRAPDDERWVGNCHSALATARHHMGI